MTAALEALVRQASVPAAALPLAEPAAEVARVMQICNACRYCEGHCAVFPAMTRRLSFSAADAHYLANLCHGCGACLHHCQYAPPHDFAVNVPRAMARVRRDTWAGYAWPAALGGAYRRNGTVVALVLAAALALFLAIAAAGQVGLWHAPLAGDFYRVFPHGLMVAMYTPVFGFAVIALGIGVRRFWRAQAPGPASREAVAEAAHDALRLKYLDGGHGEGCHEQDDGMTLERRRAHHLTFYGFALCFASTVVATLYHYALGRIAPYAYDDLPKVLGMVGGVMLAVGTAGLWRLHRRRHPLQADPAQRGMDRGFIVLLFAVAVTGLVLTLFRHTGALALLLSLHLGTVMALFLTMPYGRFAHGVYRAAALLKWSIERRQPLSLKLGSE